MSELSQPMRRALDLVRAMSPDQQDLLAAELAADLAAARRGELASEAEVSALYAKYGL